MNPNGVELKFCQKLEISVLVEMHQGFFELGITEPQTKRNYVVNTGAFRKTTDHEERYLRVNANREQSIFYF